MFRPLEAIIRSRSEYPKAGEEWVASGVEGGSLEDRDLVLPRHCESAYVKYKITITRTLSYD